MSKTVVPEESVNQRCPAYHVSAFVKVGSFYRRRDYCRQSRYLNALDTLFPGTPALGAYFKY